MNSSSDLEKTTVVILIIFVSVLILAYFVAMALGLTLFFLTPEGLAFSKQSLSVVFPSGPYVFLFTFLIIIFIPVNPNIGPIFLFLWSIYLVCFVVAWMLRESLHKVIKSSISRPLSYTLKNNLFAMPVITGMVFTAILVLGFFQTSQGIPTGEVSLPPNPFAAFFELSYAPVVEEIGFRITSIGIFLILFLFLAGGKSAAAMSGGKRLKAFFLSWLYPEKAKRMLGLKNVSDFGILRGISIPEWMAVILTSAVFGWAHYYLGGGWEIGKITLASIQGFAMGLAYLIYGVQAPILIHWYFDYYTYAYLTAYSFYPATTLLFSFSFLLTLALGVIGWIILAVILAVGVLRLRKNPGRQPEESALSTLNFS